MHAELSDKQTDHAIMSMYRKDIIGVQATGQVLKAYDGLPTIGAAEQRGASSTPQRSLLRARWRSGRPSPATCIP
jgi:hypothetical protein